MMASGFYWLLSALLKLFYKVLYISEYQAFCVLYMLCQAIDTFGVMKILHTVGWNGYQPGINFEPTFDLVAAISAAGEEIHLLLPDGAELPRHALDADSERWLRRVPNDMSRYLGRSRNISDYLRNSSYDIYHTNGLSQFINHATCATARRRNMPYLISPYGMLQKYVGETKRSLIEKVLGQLYFNRDIRMAACIRIVGPILAQSIRNLGVENPIAVIASPNAVPDFLDEAVAEGREWCAEHPDKKRVGGHIIQYENRDVDVLLHAFADASGPDDELILIMQGNAQYEKLLKEKIRARHLQDRCQLIQRLPLREHFALLASMSVVCLPYNIMSVGTMTAQSLLAETPVICVHDSDWEDLPSFECGWWCPETHDSLTHHISKALMLSEEVSARMGRNGRRMVETKYSGPVVAHQMMQLYRWLLEGGQRPDFVI